MERHEIIRKRFDEMGATVRISTDGAPRPGARTFAVDLVPGRDGEVFTIDYSSGSADPEVVDIDRSGRHLLLMIRELDEAGNVKAKPKYLCGHDERHWFVASVPTAGVRDVRSARDALKPIQVAFEEIRKGVRKKLRDRRRNDAFVRQGEWFFLPRPEFEIPEDEVRRNEPLRRVGGGKPHMLEEAWRPGREEVREIRSLVVFARGRVRHPDHRTIRLHGWHVAIANREREVPHAANLYYRD